MLREAMQAMPRQDYHAMIDAFNRGDSYMYKFKNGKFIGANIPLDEYEILEQKGHWAYGIYEATT